MKVIEEIFWNILLKTVIMIQIEIEMIRQCPAVQSCRQGQPGSSRHGLFWCCPLNDSKLPLSGKIKR